jgi:hypothetical protein
MRDLWVEESTHVIRRPQRRAAPAAGQSDAGHSGMPRERHTQFYARMTYNSLSYNSTAAEKDPDLLTAEVTIQPTDGGQPTTTPFSTACPLCKAAGADCKEHIYHTCPKLKAKRDALHAALVKVAQAAPYSASDLDAHRVATAICSRPDYYAGQISSAAHDILRASAAQAAGSAPTSRRIRATGKLQTTVLHHASKMHDARDKAVPKELKLHEFKKDMWAKQKARQFVKQVTVRQENAAKKKAAEALQRQLDASAQAPSVPPPSASRRVSTHARAAQ